MPRFCANLSTLFTEYPVLDRPAAARDAGFAAVEMQFPYGLPAHELAAATARAGVELVLFNVPAGEPGGRGFAARPQGKPAFREAVAQARRYAQTLSPQFVNVIAGAPKGDKPGCLAAFAENLAVAADAMQEIGVKVTVEPINDRDWPGYLTPHAAQVVDMLARTGHDNLGLQFDVYHAQCMGDDAVATLRRFRDRVAHIQFADAPGRHEPGTGTIDFAAVFAAIDEVDYVGYVSAEYMPTGRTEDSLGWLQPYL